MKDKNERMSFRFGYNGKISRLFPGTTNNEKGGKQRTTLQNKEILFVL